MVIRSENDAARFQQVLDLLSEWGKTWMMEFHQDKCEIITITRKRNPTLYPYRLGEHLLNHVDCSKYLGVKVSKHLRWNDHINYITYKYTELPQKKLTDWEHKNKSHRLSNSCSAST